MSAFISFHGATKIAASTVQDGKECSAHFTVNFEGENFENRGAVTFYTGDAILASRLVEAINSVVRARREEVEAANV